MKKLILLFLSFLCVSCTPMKPALSVSETNAFPVKGRQGILIRQKLSFGDYETSVVKRSWTRSRNERLETYFPVLVGLNYADSEQSYHFSMKDFFGNNAEVFAISAYHAEDLQIGNNPNSVVNIIQDIFGSTDFSDLLFYLQIFSGQDDSPWQLVLDNYAAQLAPEKYLGYFVKDDQQFYTLKPLQHINGKKGPQKILAGSLGYEIFDSSGTSVAAVSMIDNGEVYLHTKNPSERFLLSALCAALLLEQDVSEVVQ